MALAVPDIREGLSAVRQSARAAERVAEGVGEKVGLAVLLLLVGIAIYVASRLPKQDDSSDPVMRRLKEAPADDEPISAEEEAHVRRARVEGSLPWDEAKRLVDAD
jgi:hypothetical protein